MVKKMLAVADIAAMFGVDAKTVSMWRHRYKGDFPEPDVTVGELAGWDPLREAELRAWHEGLRPGQGRRPHPKQDVPEHIREMVRRTFVYKFMRPNDFAWAPIDFPGVKYEGDRLAAGMKERAAAHLVGALRSQGYELVFEDAGTDSTEVMKHVLFGEWTPEELGEDKFVGQMFDDYGRIYRGRTAFDAATHLLERIAVSDGEVRSTHN